jgi:putative sterol carrier protein
VASPNGWSRQTALAWSSRFWSAPGRPGSHAGVTKVNSPARANSRWMAATSIGTGRSSGRVRSFFHSAAASRRNVERCPRRGCSAGGFVPRRWTSFPAEPDRTEVAKLAFNLPTPCSIVPAFPSEGWAVAFRDALNANPDYAEAAKAWEGDFLLTVLPEPDYPRGLAIHLELAHGTCTSARFVTDPTQVRSEFVVESTRGNWERLLRGEIDPIQGIMSGTFRLKGNMLKAMRFQRAAKEMLDTAARVPRD